MKTNTLGQTIDYYQEHFPESLIELSELVTKFRERRESYNVTSTGNNWGYGCYASHQTSIHHISLKKMNQIKEFDRENGLITLEPGVTYNILSQYLQKNAPEWIAPVHGGGPDCSVIGNALERGYGITPIMDHFGACQALKAILPDGRIYQSPLSSIDLKHLSKKFRYGIGPYLDGMFTQSNMGIVTEMTIKLAPKSESIELFFFNFDESEIVDGVEIIRKIKTKYKGIVGGVNLMNKERMLSMLVDYPEELIKSRKPLPQELIQQKKKDFMVGDWNIVGAIYGQKEIVKATKKLIKRDIKNFKAKKVFLSQSKIQLLNRIDSSIPFLFTNSLKRTFKALTELLNILNGIPERTALKLAYWKNLSNRKIANPTHDNCGIIWYAPLVELNQKNVRDYIKFMKRVSERFDFNPIITLTTVDEMCFDSTVPILFNKEDPVDQKRAHDYFHALLEEGYLEGFYPYRFGTHSMDNFIDKLDSEYISIIDSIKKAFDPNCIYSNGRYHKSIETKTDQPAVKSLYFGGTF